MAVAGFTHCIATLAPVATTAPMTVPPPEIAGCRGNVQCSRRRWRSRRALTLGQRAQQMSPVAHAALQKRPCTSRNGSADLADQMEKFGRESPAESREMDLQAFDPDSARGKHVHLRIRSAMGWTYNRPKKMYELLLRWSDERRERRGATCRRVKGRRTRVRPPRISARRSPSRGSRVIFSSWGAEYKRAVRLTITEAEQARRESQLSVLSCRGINGLQ